MSYQVWLKENINSIILSSSVSIVIFNVQYLCLFICSPSYVTKMCIVGAITVYLTVLSLSSCSLFQILRSVMFRLHLLQGIAMRKELES